MLSLELAQEEYSALLCPQAPVKGYGSADEAYKYGGYLEVSDFNIYAPFIFLKALAYGAISLGNVTATDT